MGENLARYIEGLEKELEYAKATKNGREKEIAAELRRAKKALKAEGVEAPEGERGETPEAEVTETVVSELAETPEGDS